jgi:hypothetical protein
MSYYTTKVTHHLKRWHGRIGQSLLDLKAFMSLPENGAAEKNSHPHHFEITAAASICWENPACWIQNWIPLNSLYGFHYGTCSNRNVIHSPSRVGDVKTDYFYVLIIVNMSKTIFVTGASWGLGKAACTFFNSLQSTLVYCPNCLQVKTAIHFSNLAVASLHYS